MDKSLIADPFIASGAGATVLTYLGLSTPDSVDGAISEPVSAVEIFSSFDAGDTRVEYLIDRETGCLGLRLYPVASADSVVARREYLDGPVTRFVPQSRAWRVDPLVQVKTAWDEASNGYAQGRTMRNASSSLSLRCEDQKLRRSEDGTLTVETILRSPEGWRCLHRLSWEGNEPSPALRISTCLENTSSEPLKLEMLSSFSLGGITPFHHADAPGRLWAHRVRSSWSAEGRVESVPVEQWQLEGCWQGHSARSERFGQVGTLPTRGFFPFAAIEDRAVGVCWGAQLAWAGSWQMEFYRRGDCLSLSGGLADYEMGHWSRTLLPGESLETPTAVVASVEGNLDTLCRRLTAQQQRVFDRTPQPAVEANLPVVANEFCTSWGNPTHDNILDLARQLRGSAVRYLVIDAGWYAEPDKNWADAHGDWEPSAARFPEGLSATAAAVRAEGLIPGLWFEMETCGLRSAAFAQRSHFLQKDGNPITVGGRRFWDMCDPWVVDYLCARVIGLLRNTGIGYLKVDYNETMGIGCDGAESPGEGLRRQVEASQGFFRRLRAELPELVIENCASGGHRLEPSMFELTSMSSFSDAHETVEMPLIAANLQRMVLPRQSQVWAVLRRSDSPRRLVYSLATAFLGRMCVSGDLTTLDPAQWELFQRAGNLYEQAAGVIGHGASWHFGPPILSHRHPQGWQAIVRLGTQCQEMLIVAHGFAAVPLGGVNITLPAVACGDWQVRGELSDGLQVSHEGNQLRLAFAGDFSAAAILLRRR